MIIDAKLFAHIFGNTLHSLPTMTQVEVRAGFAVLLSCVICSSAAPREWSP